MLLNFKEVVETHQEKVRNICFRYVKDVQDAEDLAQEVFMQVYESFEQFRNEAELSTWIYRIAVNKSIDFNRKKVRKKRFGQIVSLFGFKEEGEIMIADKGKEPHKKIEDEERKKILQEAIDKLPDNQKTVIILNKYEGFKNKEIAEIMKISVSAVDSLMHRAKKNLHDMLYKYYDGRVLNI
ncbi:RNA polymerase sigma factor [Deferribacteraceae bacterium V6Fe1]|nr:RNA polymerase sigma factor [Deferribacteraceae bacterium V6Fe1]